VQRDASGELAIIGRQQQAPCGRRVISGESGEFLIEALEAQAEAKRLGVFEKEFAHLRDVGGRFRLCDRQARDCARYPINMPPFTFNTCPVM
jgi:hypothetical protein